MSLFEFEIEAREADEEFELPSYRDPGRIFVHVISVLGSDSHYRYETEVIDYDGGSVFWIQEGVGLEYWFDMHCDFDSPGFYVVEGITGSYIRGDGWTTDDDEEWEFERIRKATVDEILFEELI